jgi:hypothetical protein
MTEPQAPHHNSKPLTKKTFLPPLQKKILLYLANHDPKNKNEIAEALKSHYRSTWGAIRNLEKKNLIQMVGSKNYQGQEYPRYWLSPDGAFIALCEGAEQKSVMKRTLKIYPEKKDTHYLLETVSILGTEAFSYGYLTIKSKGRLEQSDIATMIVNQVQISPEQLIQFGKMLTNYPEQKQKFDNLITEMSEKLKNLNNVFRQIESEAKDT